MSMSALVRALGAAAGGVSSGMDAAEAAAERKRLRDEAAEDRKFTMSERTRALNMRDELGRAAAEVKPVEVKQDRPDSMDDRDVSAVGEAPLPTAGYDVAGKRFATKDEATTAAAAANTPQAVTTRMSDVLMRNGDPVQAQKLRTGAMEEQAAQFKLNDAMRADINDKFNQDLYQVKDWNGLADLFGNVHGVKFAPQVSEDGKTIEVNRVGPDGSLIPTGRVFQNNDAGFEEAVTGLARIPPEKKLNYLHQRALLAQQGQRDADKKAHDEGMLKVAQQNANTQEQYRKDQVAALKTKAESAVDKMSEAGKLQLQDLNKQDEALAAIINKGVAEGTLKINNPDDPSWAHLSQQRQQLAFKKQQLLASEGVIDGAQSVSDLISAGATLADMEESAKQAKLIGGKYAKDFMSAYESAKVTRPATTREAIAQEVKKTGDTNYLVTMNGRTQAYGNAKLPSDRTSQAPTMTSRTTGPEAPAAAPAAATNDLSKRLKAEQLEMGNGQRLSYSPEVAAYVDKLDAEKRAAAAEASAKAQAEELAKAKRNPAMALVRRDAATLK